MSFDAKGRPMETLEALRTLDVSKDDLQIEQRNQLDDVGYFVVENIFSREAAAEMAAEFDRIHALEDAGGTEVHVEPGARRVSDIFNKTDVFDLCLAVKPILASSYYLLGEFKLHGANLRDPETGGGHQQLHADVPKKAPDDWWVLNAILLFDDVTLDSGPTRVVPGSHNWPPINVPVVNTGDWRPEDLSQEDREKTPKDLDGPYPGEVLITGSAGSVVIANSSLWHSGTTKISEKPRRVLHLTYTRRDLPQQLTQLDYLTPALYDRMSPAQRYLMEIEPPADSDKILRQPKIEPGGWWN